MLADLERRAEKVKGGILTADESAAIDQQDRPLAEHFAAFLEHQKAKGITRMQLDETRSRLDRVAADCGFRPAGRLERHRLGTLACGSTRPKAWGPSPATDTAKPA